MRTGSHRLTGLLLASGFLAGWITAVWVSPPSAVTQTAPPRPAAAPPAVSVPRVALERVIVPETRPAVARNPFAFRERPTSPPAIADAPPVAVPTEVEAPPPDIDRFPWRLVGLASTDDGVSTAIVSGRGDVHLVRIGDRLPDGTEVVAIDGHQVTVRLPAGESRVLDLP